MYFAYWLISPLRKENTLQSAQFYPSLSKSQEIFLLCGATVFPELLENTATALLFLRDEMFVFFQV